MSPATIFWIHLVLGYVPWLLFLSAYVWPRLNSTDPFEAHRATFTPEGLREKRLNGGANWAGALFLRLHGEHGLRFYGDRAQLIAQLRKKLDLGEQPVGAALASSQAYLRSLGGLR